jgi:large subunit ribosomal protein L43
VNGRDKVICTRNLTAGEINIKTELLRDSSGEKIKNLAKKPVISTTESVRGIWSPFNSNPHTI